jgi:hypothetical protein
MCFWPCPTFSCLYLSLHLLMFRCFGYFWLLIGFTDSDVTIPLDSDPYGLLVISEPSDTISTPLMLLLLIPYLPLPFKKRNTSLHSQDLIRLCITSIWLRLHYPAFLDLDPRTLTSTHHILPCSTAFFWLFFVLACVLSVSLWSHSIFCYLYQTTYYKPTHSLKYPYPISIEPDITLLHPSHITHLTRNWFYQDFCTFRSFKFPAASIIY